VEFRIGPLSVHHCIDQRANEVVKGRLGVLDLPAFDQMRDLLDVAIVQSSKGRALVGDVLVDRSDTDTGDFRDAVCCDTADAVALWGQHEMESSVPPGGSREQTGSWDSTTTLGLMLTRRRRQ